MLFKFLKISYIPLNLSKKFQYDLSKLILCISSHYIYLKELTSDKNTCEIVIKINFESAKFLTKYFKVFLELKIFLANTN